MKTAPLSTLNAAEALARFPWIKGTITGAELFADDLAIVNQGTRAFAVVKGAEYMGCCPSRKYAVALVARVAAGTFAN